MNDTNEGQFEPPLLESISAGSQAVLKAIIGAAVTDYGGSHTYTDQVEPDGVERRSTPGHLSDLSNKHYIRMGGVCHYGRMIEPGGRLLDQADSFLAYADWAWAPRPLVDVLDGYDTAVPDDDEGWVDVDNLWLVMRVPVAELESEYLGAGATEVPAIEFLMSGRALITPDGGAIRLFAYEAEADDACKDMNERPKGAFHYRVVEAR